MRLHWTISLPVRIEVTALRGLLTLFELPRGLIRWSWVSRKFLVKLNRRLRYRRRAVVLAIL